MVVTSRFTFEGKLFFQSTSESQRAIRDKADERPRLERTALQIGTESLEVPALISSCLDGSSGGQDIGADALPCEMPAEMLPLMLRVLFGEAF